MYLGFNGKILRINLSKKGIRAEDLDVELVKKYLGGSGIAAKILYDETDELINPLSVLNPIIFMTGLLTGIAIPSACKTSVCSRSPQTGIWNEATVGGRWGADLKSTGYDGLIITGKSEEPVYLLISEDKVEICPARDIWGLDTFETYMIFKKKFDAHINVATIGIAGENMLKMSGIITDGQASRAAARGGLGAVLGSKNLKAIVIIRGKNKLQIKEKEKLRDLVRNDMIEIRKYTEGLQKMGTAGGIEPREIIGDLPIKNFIQGKWEKGAVKIGGDSIVGANFVKNYACYRCPIGCGKVLKIKSGPYAGEVVHGPEYETIGALGSLCLNDDPDTVIIANDLCNRYGLDTISTGVTIAFAMEAYEKGLITKEDTGGIELSWGNSEAVIKLIHQIANRKGIGKMLGNGVKSAAEELGKNSEEFAIHVKGLELPMHDPRAFVGMALSYATANRGGCHLESLSYFVEGGIPLKDLGYSENNKLDPHSINGKVELVIKMQNFMNVLNALGLCKFLLVGRIGPQKVTEWINCVTGWNLTMEELLNIGDRLHNLKRMYNIRIGISRKDDNLPLRLLTLDRKEGGAAGSLPHLGKMLGEYYELRGWTEDGIPTNKKLKELSLKV